jgi:hypothetical protein
MNANPFQPITISWDNLTPTTSDELSVEWCKKITALEVRGCGFAGSMVVPLVLTGSFGLPGGPVRHFNAQASFSLPNNAYGSKCPPMLYSMVQYGTRIYYKRFEDIFSRLTPNVLSQITNNKPTVISAFVTSIDNLHYDEITTGTFRWSFTVNHRYVHGNDIRPYGDSIFETEAPQNFRSPLLRMRTSHWPSLSPLEDDYSKNKVVLYYYAIGVDPNLV